MSRILQALKQLEARPLTEAVLPPTPPAAATPASPPEVSSTRLPTMPFVPGALERRPTEPIPPRRNKKKHKAVRVAEKAAQVLQTAAEIEQLIAELQPSVVQCWGERANEATLQVTGFDPLQLFETSAVISDGQLPEVVTIRETAPVQLGLYSNVFECRSPAQHDIAQAQPQGVSMRLAEAAGIGSVMVYDQLPLVITIEAEPTSLPPVTTEAPEARTPVLALSLFTPAVFEQSLLPSDWLTPSIAEVDQTWTGQASSAIVVTEHMPEVITIRERVSVPAPAPAPVVVVHDEALEWAALEALEELRAMLRGIAPSVTEHWIPVADERGLLVEHASGLLNSDACASSIIATDYAPQVITLREPREVIAAATLTSDEKLADSHPTLSREELTALLCAPQVSVMEAWLPTTEEAALVIEQTADLTYDHASAGCVIASDYAPQVITVREPSAAASEEVEPASRYPARMVTEPMRRDYDAVERVAEQLPQYAQEALDTLLGPAPISVVESFDSSSNPWQAPAVDLITNNIDWSGSDHAPSLLVESYSPAVTSVPPASQPPVAAKPEVELHFQPAAPRRRAMPASQSVSKSRRQRHLPRIPDQREQQMRTLVRGPRGLGTTPLTAWEGTLREELRRGSQAGAYRQLAQRWQADQIAHHTSTMLVTSLGEAWAASDVVMHAAMLLAEGSDNTVLVIDGDDDGTISRRLGLSSKTGLGELLSPYDAHGETIFPTGTPRLHVLPRGRSLGALDPASPALRSLLADLAHEYGWILLTGGRWDSPLLIPLARVAGGTYVVAPLTDLNPTDATRAVAALRNSGARMLGSIIIEG